MTSLPQLRGLLEGLEKLLQPWSSAPLRCPTRSPAEFTGWAERHYRVCTAIDRIDAPLARPWDTNLPVYLCRDPHGTIADLWPELRHYGHLTNAVAGSP